MKQFSFASLLILGIAFTVFALHACQSDEMDTTEQTTLSAKARLLLEKSKVFSQKYGIEMRLNEDSIETIAQTLTVEEMEADYKQWAACKKMKGETKSFRIRKNVKQTANGLRLRSKTPEREVVDHYQHGITDVAHLRYRDEVHTFEMELAYKYTEDVRPSENYTKFTEVEASVQHRSGRIEIVTEENIPLYSTYTKTGEDIHIIAIGRHDFELDYYTITASFTVNINTSNKYVQFDVDLY